jgi:hypothetical protein
VCTPGPSPTRSSSGPRALLALAALALLAAPAPARADGVGLQLLDVPAAARHDPRARLYIVDHLAPGAVIHRRIRVSSFSRSTERVALYPAAATIGRGSFLVAAGRTRDELSTWTSVAPKRSTIAADGRSTAVVTIAVPRDAAPGEHYGVIWAEVRSRPIDDIVHVGRVGIRVYLSVGGGAAPAPDFVIRSLTASTAADGRPTILASVRNTGGRALDMSGSLRLGSGPGGLRAGPFPATLGVTLAIGDTETVTVPLDRRLPAGPWNAGITLRSGLLQRTRRATVTFPTRSSSSGTPLLTIALAAGLVLALAGLVAQRAQASRRRRGASPIAVAGTGRA